MRAKDLLAKIEVESSDTRDIKGISFDSKRIEEGYLFVARKGENHDGNNYIEEAFRRGAICVVSDSCSGSNIYKCYNIDEKKDILIQSLYDLSGIKLIGITGTNGKTSTCHLIYQALQRMNIGATYIGTLGIIDKNYRYNIDNTTPEIDVLANEIYKAKKRNCKYVVMEVSSHSISLNRVKILNFDVIGFTNLTQDHLDYYKSLDNYFKSKKKLFDMACENCIGVVNYDDIYSKEITKDFKGKIIGYGKNSEYEYEIIDNSIKGVEVLIDNITIKSKLLFNTNIYNLVMAYLVLKSLGFEKDLIKSALDKSEVINGRGEILYNQEYNIILDYAHTPDAMERILLESNKIKENRIVTVFGCGGNRDIEKRAIMGYIANLNSDLVYICNDNPRFEDEDKIIDDILTLIKDRENVRVIKDRKDAICKAISNLQEKDILLILGKGHEEYQIIKDKKIHLSDREIVRECLKK